MARLEEETGLTIDAYLVESQNSPTDFNVVPLRHGDGFGRIRTDVDCGHPPGDFCGDCHVCGEHREMYPEAAGPGHVMLCSRCRTAYLHWAEPLREMAAEEEVTQVCRFMDQEGRIPWFMHGNHRNCGTPGMEQLLQVTARLLGLEGPQEAAGSQLGPGPQVGMVALPAEPGGADRGMYFILRLTQLIVRPDSR